MRGDVSGDLVVTIQVLEDEHFERQGDDLVHVLEIDAIDAMLGCETEFDGILPGERVSVSIPKGCQYAQQVILEGLGMPRIGTTTRGRMVVAVRVTIPTELDGEDVLLLEKVRSRRPHTESAASQKQQADEPKKTRPTKGRQRKRPFRGGKR